MHDENLKIMLNHVRKKILKNFRQTFNKFVQYFITINYGCLKNT